MRAFIAIDLPSEIKDVIYNLQKKIGSDLAKINWVHKKNLHLTLKFFTDISELNAKKVINTLGEIEFKPFKVRLEKIGYFPNENNIRVVWIGLGSSGEIMNLQGEVDAKLSKDFPREKKFVAHLTLGRVKAVKNKNLFIQRLKDAEIPKAEFEVSKISFYESKLTKEGPIYKKII